MNNLARVSLIRHRQPSNKEVGHSSERREDERGLLMLSITIILTIAMFVVAFTMTTGAIDQLQLGSYTSNRDSAVQGALAGVQAMVANIRAANTGGYVVLSELPCNNVSGLTNTSGSPSFTTSVQYQDQNSSGTFTSVTCTQGQGPAAASTGEYLAQAIITSCSPASACPTNPRSTPIGHATWRRVVSTYDFDTSYANTPGGLINSYSGKECLDAIYNNGTDPSGGVTLGATTSCSTTNILEQFQYTTNWNLAIELGGVQYCVQDSEDATSAVASPVPITTPCTSTAVAQWGINDSGGIEGVATSSSPAGQPNSFCVNNPLSGDPTGNVTEDATIGNCDGGFDNTTTWLISPEVGAGASQPPTGQVFGVTDQLVNFEEFGDCLDVTNQSVSSSFLIDYMCKQFPDTTDYPVWNQRWYFNQLSTSNGNPVGTIYTIDSSVDYCLQSPLATASTSATAYVTLTSCTPGSTSQASNLLWTEWGTNGGMLHDYTWTDNDGYCLEANTANQQTPSGNGDLFSTIQVDTCNDSFEQKWNAPPILGESQIINTHEGTGSASYSGS